MYGEALEQGTQGTFCKWASWIPERVNNREGMEHPLLIVPASFRAMRYISEVFYLPGVTSPEPEQVRQAQNNYVRCVRSDANAGQRGGLDVFLSSSNL